MSLHQSLSLSWVFGLNKNLFNLVHNLSDQSRHEIFYAAGHIGILYDYDRHEQRLLQGHTSAIESVCVSQDKRWIVTADSGKDSLIVVWDSLKAIPIKTIFSPHDSGIKAIDISYDSMYISSISHPDEEGNQEIAIWQWTSETNDPAFISTIPTSDPQVLVRFHPSSTKLLVTNGIKRVIFWGVSEGQLKSYAPPVSFADFRQPVGEFTQTIFVPKTNLAATATNDGDIILWEQVKGAKPIEKQALKVIRVHDGPINILTSISNKYIVTGGEDGFVRFFDYQLRLEAWFEEFDGGPITSISFEKDFTNKTDLQSEFGGTTSIYSEFTSFGESRGQDAAQISDTTFIAPDFVVSTSLALIIKVKSDSFNDYEAERVRGDLLVQGQEGAIQTFSAHPKRPYLAISGLSGHLHLWDYESKKVLSLTMFKDLLVTTIKFDPKGQYLAVGTTSGVVKILDGSKLEEIQTFQPRKDRIIAIDWSHDSLVFACSDSGNHVQIYKWGHRDEDERKPIEWVYVGRYKSHKDDITAVKFGLTPYGDVPRLISVGKDRRLVEYDLQESSITKGVKVKNVYKIGQTAVPTSLLWSQAKNLTVNYSKEKKEFDSLLFSNDQYKFLEFVTPDTGKDTYCKKTLLCPTFGGSVTKMLLLPANAQYEPKYLAYCTSEKVIGLVHLPIDGNPNKTMGIIAHSGEIRDFECSPDGKYLFTAGGTDFCVNQWRIKGEFLDQEAKKYENGDDVDTFISLIEGGKEGEFFDEIKQYFYYAQIRSQGEVTTNERKISGEVPLHQIPFIIRALGFYATEYEVNNLMTELKTLLGFERNSHTDHELVDFDTFIKLYVNHKPYIPIGKTDIDNAFKEMTKNNKETDLKIPHIRKDDLFELLTTKGEKMTHEELQEILANLLEDDYDLHQLEMFTSQDFAENVLGFEDDDEDVKAENEIEGEQYEYDGEDYDEEDNEY